MDPNAHALITLTTGSTGTPKAAVRSHAFLWAQHQALAAHLQLTEADPRHASKTDSAALRRLLSRDLVTEHSLIAGT